MRRIFHACVVARRAVPLLAILAIAIVFSGCDLSKDTDHRIPTTTQTHQTLPPGWSMKYNTPQTLWRIYMPGRRSIVPLYCDTYNNKQTAINQAWEQYEMYKKQADENTWHDYKE